MTSAPDPRRLVADGYDAAADAYARWLVTSVVDPARPRYLDTFAALLPSGARVLELGCGGGGPTTQALAQRFVLTGIDLSTTQIALARRHVPEAEFQVADMTRYQAQAASFDGVAAFYSLIHLPYGELSSMLVRIAGWLRDDGILVATLAARDGGDGGEHIEPEWLAGVPMYWSGYPVEETLGYLGAAGLTAIEANIETAVEDGEEAPFLWIVARKTASNTSGTAT